jgi:hypothetical protein
MLYKADNDELFPKPKTKKAWKRLIQKLTKRDRDFTVVIDCNYSLHEHHLSISEYVNMLINDGALIPMEVKRG